MNTDRLREAAELVARHCTNIVRLPNAEHVADAHNAALSELRAALVEKPVPLTKGKTEPFCYLKQTSSERHPPHGWAVHFTEGEIALYTADALAALSAENERLRFALATVPPQPFTTESSDD